LKREREAERERERERERGGGGDFIGEKDESEYAPGTEDVAEY